MLPSFWSESDSTVRNQDRNAMNTWWNFKMNKSFLVTIFTKKQNKTLAVLFGIWKWFGSFVPSLQLLKFWGLALSELSNRWVFFFNVYCTLLKPFIVLILKRIVNYFQISYMSWLNLCFHTVFILTFFPFQVSSCFISSRNNVLRTFCPQ